jgi:hypothetical protein
MARIFQTGFETGDLGAFDSTAGIVSIGTTYKRTGNYSMHFASMISQPGYAAKSFASPVTEIFARFGLYIESYSAAAYRNEFIAYYDSAGGAQLVIRLNADAHIEAVLNTGSSSTILATGSMTLVSGNWYVVRVRYVVNDLTGIVQIYLGDTLDIDYSGDTCRTANVNVQTIRFGEPVSTSSTYLVANIDDIVINDTSGSVNNSWPNLGGIIGLLPSGAGNYTELTPSTGDNYTCVDEAPASDTDYVASSTADARDTYAMSNLPGPCNISAVCWRARAQESDAGGTHIARLFRIGSTDYQGSDLLLGTSWANYSEILETSPATSSAFTKTELDAIEAGVRVRS